MNIIYKFNIKAINSNKSQLYLSHQSIQGKAQPPQLWDCREPLVLEGLGSPFISELMLPPSKPAEGVKNSAANEPLVSK